MPPFYRKVLSEVSKIPFGSVLTYKDVAKMSGNIKAFRAVGTANSSNPLPIIIPCHRVISSNGSIGGYAYGLEMKKKLLKLEQHSLNVSLALNQNNQ
ncbi:MGMT family protein [Candidatus Marinimicrobia bacterium]|nr:MGMT family protein [Candidatus Neomarinimicrobiota bacterium]